MVSETNLNLRNEIMEDKINRSSVMKTIGVLGVASALVSGKAFGQIKKATVLACIGDGSSPYEIVKPAVESTIEKGLNLTVDYTNDTAMLNDSMLAGYRMLILIGDSFREKEKRQPFRHSYKTAEGFCLRITPLIMRIDQGRRMLCAM